MKKIIRKILREQFGYKQQLFDLLRTHNENNLEMVRMISQGQDIDILELLIEFFKENPKPPYFKILNHFDLSEDELINVLSEMYGEPVKIEGESIYDEDGNEIYFEDSDSYWEKREYDDNGNITYLENSNGNWSKAKFNENGNLIYLRRSDGYWEKYQYDEWYGNQTYHENSDGYWEKYGYDENGDLIYIEYSDGEIEDYR